MADLINEARVILGIHGHDMKAAYLRTIDGVAASMAADAIEVTSCRRMMAELLQTGLPGHLTFSVRLRIALLFARAIRRFWQESPFQTLMDLSNALYVIATVLLDPPVPTSGESVDEIVECMQIVQIRRVIECSDGGRAIGEALVRGWGAWPVAAAQAVVAFGPTEATVVETFLPDVLTEPVIAFLRHVRCGMDLVRAIVCRRGDAELLEPVIRAYCLAGKTLTNFLQGCLSSCTRNQVAAIRMLESRGLAARWIWSFSKSEEVPAREAVACFAQENSCGEDGVRVLAQLADDKSPQVRFAAIGPHTPYTSVLAHVSDTDRAVREKARTHIVNGVVNGELSLRVILLSKKTDVSLTRALVTACGPDRIWRDMAHDLGRLLDSGAPYHFTAEDVGKFLARRDVLGTKFCVNLAPQSFVAFHGQVLEIAPDVASLIY